jgi:hypothetical protein
MIEIVSVSKFYGTDGHAEGYSVTGEIGQGQRSIRRIELVKYEELQRALEDDPTRHALQDLAPTIVTLAFPRLVRKFKS